MISRTLKGRKGLTLIELLTVVVIVSVLAAIAQPLYFQIIVKARAADAISELQVVRVALYNYQSDNQAWPSEASSGIVPPGLEGYLPVGFDLVKEDYTLDFDNWGGTPFVIGITLITSDSLLGRTTLEMMASPKWNTGDKYTWVIE